MKGECRRYEDKVAIVTGGAGGIGLAACQRLGYEGCRVVVADLKVSEEARVAVCDAGAPDALAIACDVSKEEDAIATVQLAIAKWGKIDLIVNNAGVMTFKPLVEHTAEDWHRVLAVDLMGAFFFTKQAFLKMKPGSTIVNISSVHARVTEPRVASYAAAKAAILSLTRSASLEGKPLGIRVNAIMPGAIDTPMLWNNPLVKSGEETINKQDVGRPEDVAAAIAFLGSPDAAFIQGDAFRVDGGRLDRL